MKLDQLKIIVTGAAQGIGEACARRVVRTLNVQATRWISLWFISNVSPLSCSIR